jgi:hypothetical protein
MTQNRMTVHSRGRVTDPDHPHISTSYVLPQMYWGIAPSSGDPSMTFGLEQRIDALTREIIRLEQLVHSMSQQIETLLSAEPEDATGILDLQPLSRRRVNAEVRRYYEPDRLQILEDTEDIGSEDTEE